MAALFRLPPSVLTIEFFSLCADTGRFYLENQVSEQESQELVDLTVERLKQVDQPSLNTIKLQIGYDSAYVKQEVQR